MSYLNNILLTKCRKYAPLSNVRYRDTLKLRQEVEDVIRGAKWDYARSFKSSTQSMDEAIARNIVKWLALKLNGKEPPKAKPGMMLRVKAPPVPWGMGRQVGHRRLKPEKLQAWQEEIAWRWREAHGEDHFTGPVGMSMVFRVKTARSDLDNLAKGAIDALKKLAFQDDNRVYHLDITKMPAEEKDLGMECSIFEWLGPAFQRHLDG